MCLNQFDEYYVLNVLQSPVVHLRRVGDKEKSGERMSFEACRTKLCDLYFDVAVTSFLFVICSSNRIYSSV